MRQSATLLLAALVALAAAALPAHAGSMNVPAETLTGVDYCLESAKPAGATKQLCYLCHPTRASAWRADGTGTVSQVGIAARSTSCRSCLRRAFLPGQVSRHRQLLRPPM